MQSIEGEVEIENCSPKKLMELFRGKQLEIPNICSHRVSDIQAHHGDWTTVGTTTRRWDYFTLQGEPRYVTERIESVDEANNTIMFAIIDGEIMKMFYKTFVGKMEAIPKGNNCLVKWTLNYEKHKEDCPEPQDEMEFLLALVKDIGDHPITNP